MNVAVLPALKVNLSGFPRLTVKHDLPESVSTRGKSKYSFVVSQNKAVGYYLVLSEDQGVPSGAIYMVNCDEVTDCSFGKIDGKELRVGTFGERYVAMSVPSDHGFKCTPVEDFDPRPPRIEF